MDSGDWERLRGSLGADAEPQTQRGVPARCAGPPLDRQSCRLITMVNELLDLARIEARQGMDWCIESLDVGTLMHGWACAWSSS